MKNRSTYSETEGAMLFKESGSLDVFYNYEKQDQALDTMEIIVLLSISAFIIYKQSTIEWLKLL